MRHSAPELSTTAAAGDGAVPRLLLSRAEAAAALGMSLRHFQRHVQPHIRCVYSGQLRLYPVRELERWTEAEASEPATAA
jgi:hypothetical protein